MGSDGDGTAAAGAASSSDVAMRDLDAAREAYSAGDQGASRAAHENKTMISK